MVGSRIRGRLKEANRGKGFIRLMITIAMAYKMGLRRTR
jgi:hypothetical protein